MFSSIGFLSLSRFFLNSPPFLTPSIFLNSISACLPISFLISAIKGVTVLFKETAVSIRDLSTLVVDITFCLTLAAISSGNTLLSSKFLYFLGSGVDSIFFSVSESDCLSNKAKASASILLTYNGSTRLRSSRSASSIRLRILPFKNP